MSASSHFRLLDLLRRRKELLPAEVCRLLEELPAKLDALRPPLPVALLNRVAVCFPAQGLPSVREEAFEQSVTEWPAFSLLLLPKELDETVGSPLEVSGLDDEGGVTKRLATLIYELLGGSRRDALGTACYSPLAHLSETANELLRHAFAGHELTGCGAFWQKWKLAAGGSARSTPSDWRIPPWLLPKVQCGGVLELTPFRSGHPPVRLTAHRAFSIGRSKSDVDFPVRFSGSNGQSERDVKELSRRHVLAELSDVGVVLRDGDGSKPSTNGSAFDSEPLDFDRPRRLERRGVLALTDACRLEVAPVFRSRAIAFETANFQDWLGASAGIQRTVPVAGAVFFVPLDGSPTLRDAVWLFSEIGFALSPKGRLLWTEQDDETVGWFVYRSGAFWIANRLIEEGHLCIDDSPISTGQIAPLVGGCCLRIGNFEFSVTVA